MPTAEELAWLAGPDGWETCRAMAGDRPADTPAGIEHWRERLPANLVTAAWAQVESRRAAAGKFERAEQMLFDRIGLEQSSGQPLAEHKARRFAGLGRVADLCCGIGGDALALARRGSVVCVDRNGSRTTMAAHNVGVYGGTAEVLVGDVELTMPDADAAHIDPDRRPSGGRRHSAAESSPGLEVLEQVVRRYGNVAVKLSPGAALDQLPFPAEIELISEQGTCKQAVAWAGGLAEVFRRATVLPSGEQITAINDSEMTWPTAHRPLPGGILVEPDPAVIRAHLVGPLARRFGLAPVDREIAWLSGASRPATTLARSFEIIDITDFALKKLRSWLTAHGAGPVDFKTRGFAASPEDLLRGLKPGPGEPLTVFVTRLAGRPTAILARRLA